MAEREYEVIIVGGGPNGLTAGAYLAKAGLRVLILDAELEVGGGLATEMVTIPPFLHNTHSIFHMMVDAAPVYKDFELEANYSVKYCFPSLQVAMPFLDGTCLCLYRDVDKTCESIARFSKRDAETYRKMRVKWKEYFDEFLGPATYVHPIATLEQAANMEKSDLGRELMEYGEKSPQEIIEELFEDDHVKTLLLYLACHWGLEHDITGLGFIGLLYLDRATNYQLALGGSHTVGSALNKVIVENGGMCLGNKRVTKIVTDNGAAVGVEVKDGTSYSASKAILSTLDPEQTFLKLVGEKLLDDNFVLNIRDWQWEEWSLLQVHLALEEAPKFKAAESEGEIDRSLVYILGYENTENLIEHFTAIRSGRVSSEAGFLCTFPSVHDPLQAPRDRCTGLISQMAPYEISGNSKDWLKIKYKEALMEQRVATLQKYAPNMNLDKVLWSYVCTPGDIVNKFANMVKGSIKHGAYHPFQMGYLRPNPECSHNRTPVEKLYVGGASVHPGGLVTFGAGYLAANAIVDDLGIEKWWTEPESVTRAKEKGLL